MMHQVIDDRSRRSDSLVSGLFVPAKEPRPAAAAVAVAPKTGVNGSRQRGSIQNLKPGFGFIAPQGGAQNLFFFHTEVANADFNDLRVGMPVSFSLGSNHKGPCAIEVEILSATA